MKENELKELEQEIRRVQSELEKIGSDLDHALSRKVHVEESIKGFDERFEELRKERQRILAQGENADQINLRIKKLKEENELEQDELIGLTRRMEELNQKRSRLRNEKIELEKDHLALLSIPLVRKFNEHAESMASALSQLWGYLDQMEETIESNRAFSASTWEALKVVPRLYLPSENVKNMQDWFRRVK